ncbi:hypothetical protein ACHHYP_00048 [Achlya hypogyna]|uniref:PX domain-containing protein n=1 Tax=Achlya hypogyna TaxID=1202772 RepID=A0A1V9ZCN5_ACHHY|nr:hypothetical protein ACHHYP_00048 [Achlya hypogyna]
MPATTEPATTEPTRWAHPPVSTSALVHTRVVIQRATVTLPAAASTPRDQDIAFVLRVAHHDAQSTVVRSWPAFQQLQRDLLRALEPGHACHGVCVYLWEDLRHNFDRPSAGTSLGAWWSLQRNVHTKETIQIYLRHFQELLNSLLHVLHVDDVKCPRLRNLTSALCHFLALEPKKRPCKASA